VFLLEKLRFDTITIRQHLIRRTLCKSISFPTIW